MMSSIKNWIASADYDLKTAANYRKLVFMGKL